MGFAQLSFAGHSEALENHPGTYSTAHRWNMRQALELVVIVFRMAPVVFSVLFVPVAVFRTRTSRVWCRCKSYFDY